MWYFAWVLGLAAACFFSILNALWFEIKPEDSSSTRSEKQKDF
jgi:cyd operon protein YbgT